MGFAEQIRAEIYRAEADSKDIERIRITCEVNDALCVEMKDLSYVQIGPIPSPAALTIRQLYGIPVEVSPFAPAEGDAPFLLVLK